MPVGFYIGPLFIRYYGIILMVGAMIGAWLATREAERLGEDGEIVWDLLIWLLIGGIIGARLWHILTPPPSMVEQGVTVQYYLSHPLDAINTRNGGLGIPGAVIGGVLALYLYTHKKKLSFLVWTDVAAPGLALAQAIGRWGNFINQEVYGRPTTLPWAIHIDPMYRIPGFEQFETFHPLFLYESIWNLLNMGTLLWISRKYRDRLKPGDVFLIYLLIYPFGRFFLDFLRLDASQIGSLNANQTLMVIVFTFSAVTLFLRHRVPANSSSMVDPEE